MMPVGPVQRIRIADLLAGDEACHFAERTIGGTERVPVHGHDFVELFWISRGRGTETTVTAALELTAGDVVFVPADAVHAFDTTAGEAMTICNLAFARGVWAELRRRYGSSLIDAFAAGGRRFRVPHLLDQIEEAAAELRTGRRTRLAMDRFVLRLDAALTHADEATSAGPAWLMDGVRALTDPAADLSDGHVALVDACGRSAEHVARSCRQYLGRTPTQLIDEARVRRAARLMADTDRSVLEVCFDSGFNNVGHFHARFLAWYGQTPRQYRVRARGTIRVESRAGPG